MIATSRGPLAGGAARMIGTELPMGAGRRDAAAPSTRAHTRLFSLSGFHFFIRRVRKCPLFLRQNVPFSAARRSRNVPFSVDNFAGGYSEAIDAQVAAPL